MKRTRVQGYRLFALLVAAFLAAGRPALPDQPKDLVALSHKICNVGIDYANTTWGWKNWWISDHETVLL